MSKTPEERYKTVQTFAKYSGLGLQMAVSLGLPIAGGLWLDQRYGFSPWALFVGIVFGLVSVFLLLFKLAHESARKP